MDENRISPWLATALYIAGVTVLLLIGWVWHGLRWDLTDLALLSVIAWGLWLTIDRANLIDYAEQAAVDADTAASRYDQLMMHHTSLLERFNRLEEWLVAEAHDTHPTEPVPTVPPTEPMERVWDSAAALLVDEAKFSTVEFGGRTFRFRNPDA